MNIPHIIGKALVDYDSAQSVIKYLLKNTNLSGYKSNSDSVRTHFIFSDKEDKNKIILKTEVEILGIFYDKYNIWTWGWAHVGGLKSETYLAKEILNYALKLGIEMSYIKTILTTSRGVVTDDIQLGINLALGCSIIKKPYIYPDSYPVGDYNIVYYFILLDNSELDKIKENIIKNKTIDITDDEEVYDK
uniref:Uncharacterized protein n=1 Tax=viral metagenome TaxID=1070528 RepID=A0A6C0LRI8_9ZZZZ